MAADGRLLRFAVLDRTALHRGLRTFARKDLGQVVPSPFLTGRPFIEVALGRLHDGLPLPGQRELHLKPRRHPADGCCSTRW